MFVVVALFVLFGMFLGAVSYLPLPVTVAAAVVIVGWLAHFTVRERRIHHHTA